MASIYFYLRGTNPKKKRLYIRFTHNRSKRYTVKTNLHISESDWGKGLPIKSGSPYRKNLYQRLTELKTTLNKEFNLIKEDELNQVWVEKTVNNFFGNTEKETENLTEKAKYLLEYIHHYNELKKDDTSLSKSTKQKYRNLAVKIERFEKSGNNRKHFQLNECTEDFFKAFKDFLTGQEGLMESTANRTLKNLKTVLLYAKKKGKEISKDLIDIKTPAISGKKVWLSFGELLRISNTVMISKELNAAKDWLIIGCYTGQRVSDLLRMNPNMIYSRINSKGEKYEFIELIQTKNREKKIREGKDPKKITIPIHAEVRKILNKRNGNFPEIFSTNNSANATLFNRYLKKVCEIAGIDQRTEGKVYNETLKRHEIVETEKFNLISSHVCRRSFATNFYGDNRFTTPQLIAITGHEDERVFLDYIGKTSADHAMRTAETFAQIEQEQKFG